MRKTVAAVLGVVAMAAVVTTAYAMTVTYSPETGGWSGKGDVQAAFGWNNKAMQTNHTSVTFEYDNTTEYSWACEWYTGPDHNIQHHVQPRTKTFGVQGVIGNTDRRTGQWTGWFLSPIDGGSNGDFTPTCPGNEDGGGNSGAKTVVEGSLVETSLGGGLYAVFNGDRRLLQ